MLIGKDFEKIHENIIGLIINEPNVFISDFIMASISFYCGISLLKSKNQTNFTRWWIYFYIIFGLSTLTGGFGHALFYYFKHYGKYFTWFSGIFSIYLIERAMISVLTDPVKQRNLKRLAHLKIMLVYSILIGILFKTNLDQNPSLPFIPVAFNTIVGVSLFAGYYGYKLAKSKHPHFKFFFYGVMIMLPSAFFYLGKINIHPWFDKNDASHLLLSIGIILFFRGITLISNESVLKNSNA
jgi:hypothetical protein